MFVKLWMRIKILNINLDGNFGAFYGTVIIIIGEMFNRLYLIFLFLFRIAYLLLLFQS